MPRIKKGVAEAANEELGIDPSDAKPESNGKVQTISKEEGSIGPLLLAV